MVTIQIKLRVLRVFHFAPHCKPVLETLFSGVRWKRNRTTPDPQGVLRMGSPIILNTSHYTYEYKQAGDNV